MSSLQLAESKSGKNRLHLDLDCDDFDAELARLVTLGARVVAPRPGWTTLADPEGNEFCLMRPATRPQVP